MKIQAIDALLILCPNAEFVLSDGKIVEWHSPKITQPTEEEINAKITELSNSEPMKLLREERNKRLSETDWTQLPDTLVNAAVDYIPLEQSWKDYRQRLRDLPSKSNPKLDSFGELDMTSVDWPTKPS